MTVFSITIEPTLEMFDAPINGQQIPTRVWVGRTSNGTPIEAYVLSIVAMDEANADKLHRELPDCMMRSRDKYKIGTDEQRAQWKIEQPEIKS